MHSDYAFSNQYIIQQIVFILYSWIIIQAG